MGVLWSCGFFLILGSRASGCLDVGLWCGRVGSQSVKVMMMMMMMMMMTNADDVNSEGNDACEKQE